MGFKVHLEALSQAVMGVEPDASGRVSVPYSAVRAVLLYAADRSASHQEAHEALAARVEKLEDALKPRDHPSSLSMLDDAAIRSGQWIKDRIHASADAPLSEQVQGSLIAQLASSGQVRLVMASAGNDGGGVISHSTQGASPQRLVIDRRSALACAILNGDPVTITASYSPPVSFEVTGGAGGGAQ